MKKNIIIIGAGHAGGIVASELSKHSKEVAISIFGDEPHYPYQRPQLSKAFIKGEIEERSLFLKSNAFYEKNNINVITNTKIVKIDKDKKIILCEKGYKHKYDFLVIATGSKLTKLGLSCSNSHINYLRTIEDSLTIKNCFSSNKNLVVIGAGYIGLELVCYARHKGLKTIVIEQDKRVMRRSVSREISEFFLKKHINHGVQFIFGKMVENIQDHKTKKRIHLNDSQYFEADEVIIGIGVKPRIELAIDAGIKCSNGIEVNKYGQTSDVSIYAAGDCTYHYNETYKKQLRLESVQNAVEQSKAVALAVLGEKQAYNKVPWFWSDQYDTKLQIAGIRENYDDSMKIGCLKDEKFSCLYLKNNRLIAVESINDPKTFLKAKKLIGSNGRTNLDEILI